jgi:hypothetical protein
MDRPEDLERIASALDAVPSLHETFGAEPQVVWMPSPPNSADKRVLFVGLFLAEAALTRQSLAFVCSRTITELNAQKALPKDAALEIMACVARGVTAERVLRLRVQSKAMANAELLTADDIGKVAPSDGIHCTVFWRTLS